MGKNREKRIAKRQKRIEERKERIDERIEKKISRRKRKGKPTKRLEQKEKRIDERLEKRISKIQNLDNRIKQRNKTLKAAGKGSLNALEWISKNSPWLATTIEVLADVSSTIVIAAAVAGTGGLGLGVGILLVQQIQVAKEGLEIALAASVTAEAGVKVTEAVIKSIKEGNHAHDILSTASKGLKDVAKTTGNKDFNNLANSIDDVVKESKPHLDLAEAILKNEKSITDIKIPVIKSGKDIPKKKPKKLKPKKLKPSAPPPPLIKQKKKKRAPSAYNIHVKEHILAGGNFKTAVSAWNKKQKKGDVNVGR